MPRFAEVTHHEWIAAPETRVRCQFADLRHHIDAGVHPKLRFEILHSGAQSARYVQKVRLLGIRQRDVFERRFGADGAMLDTSVEGFNRGGSLQFDFRPERRDDRDGTDVQITVRLPLPPVIGGLIRPLLEGQIRRELRAAAGEDKRDIEVRGYPQASGDDAMSPIETFGHRSATSVTQAT
jgi:hypothetical protein